MGAETLVSKNYARALLQLIQKEEMNVDDALSESRGLQQILRDNVKLRIFLEGPQFREEEKSNLVKNVFEGNMSTPLYHFLLLLIKRDRLYLLMEILSEFDFFAQKYMGVVPGVVTTAVSLSDEEKQQIQERLESFAKQRFSLQFNVDPSLIGGMKVQYGDTLIDSTIETQLNDLRYKLQSSRLAS